MLSTSQSTGVNFDNVVNQEDLAVEHDADPGPKPELSFWMGQSKHRIPLPYNYRDMHMHMQWSNKLTYNFQPKASLALGVRLDIHMHKLTHCGPPEGGPKVCVGVTRCVGLGERFKTIHIQMRAPSMKGEGQKRR